MDLPQQSSIQELVQRGESQTLEFKKSLSLQREGLEALCAMVNSDLAHGTVVFGVEKDGTVYGIEEGNLDTAQRSLSQAIRNKFDPPLIVIMKVEELNGEKVLAISAERSRDVPSEGYQVLDHLFENGTDTASEIASHTGLSSGQVMRKIEEFKKRGLVEILADL